jgi:ribonuclease HI
MAKQKFYVLEKSDGERRLYTNWNDVLKDKKGSELTKSFTSRAEAEGVIAMQKMIINFDPDHLPEAYAFTDGSYNKDTKTYGYGGFIHVNGEDETIQGSGKCRDDQPNEWQITGELLGAKEAIERAVNKGLSEIVLFYDYVGIAAYPTGMFTPKPNTVDAEYASFVASVKDKIKVYFCHVKAHTGIPGNETADRMAKEAAGIV